MICRECYENILKDNQEGSDIVCPCCNDLFTRVEWEFLDARHFIREKIKSEIKSVKNVASLVCDHAKKTCSVVRTEPLSAGLIIAAGVFCNLMSRAMLSEGSNAEHLSGMSAMIEKSVDAAVALALGAGPLLGLGYGYYANEYIVTSVFSLYSIGFGAAAGAPSLYRVLRSSTGPHLMRVIRAAQALWSNKIRCMNGRQPLPNVCACQGRV